MGKVGRPKKVPIWDRLTHFSVSDFSCSCGRCHGVTTHESLVEAIEDIAVYLDLPVHVVESARCIGHNERLGKDKFDLHCCRNGEGGRALTVRVPTGKDLALFLQAALGKFNGVGINKDYIHLEIDPKREGSEAWVIEED
jgi:hypothetical protein